MDRKPGKDAALRPPEQELQNWVRRLTADPANEGNPLLAEFSTLADRHAKLLRQLTKIAKISDRLQGETKEMAQQQRQLLLMIGHEFRTPLAIIDSATQMLEMERGLPATAQPRVRKIRNAVQRMLHLMDRCVVDDRLGGVARTSFDLAALLIELAAEAGGNAPDHAISTSGCSVPAMIAGDRDLLAVVFSNLVENAVKYSPAGGTVQIRLEREADWVVVSVADTGIGINAADSARIFEKYFRASNAAGTAGAGLGLYLAHRIVETHGGTIEVSSEPDHGATFVVRLPMAEGPRRNVGAEGRR